MNNDRLSQKSIKVMEELHADSIDGGHEASYGARSRARGGRTPTLPLERSLASVLGLAT